MTNGWLEGKRGRYRLGELLARAGDYDVYLAAEANHENQERYIATFITLQQFNPLLESPMEPVLGGSLISGLPPPQPWPFVKAFIATRARRYKVRQAAPLPHAGLSSYLSYGRLKALVDSVPREVVGPKTRRRLTYTDHGIILRYEAGVPVGTYFEVFAVKLKPPIPTRKGNFPPPVRRAILEAADYKCQECGSSDRPQVDHVKPLWQGGEPTFENGQVLCRACHLRKSKGEGSFGI